MSRRVYVASQMTPEGDSHHHSTSVDAGRILCGRRDMLVWAKELFMARGAFEQAHLHYELPEFQQNARLFLDMLRDEGVISLVDERVTLPPITMASIREQIATDCTTMPDKACLIDGCGDEWCLYTVVGAYGSLTLARFVGATCLVDKALRQYLEARFSAVALENAELRESFGIDGYRDIYDVFVPADLHLPFCHGPADGVKCDECRGNGRRYVMEAMSKLMHLRESRELQGLGEYVDTHLAEFDYSSARTLQALHRDLFRHQSRLAKTQAAVKQWSRIAAVTSLPLSLLGVSSSSSLVKVAGPAMAALATGSERIVELLTDQHSWKTTLADGLNYDSLAKALRDADVSI